MLFNRGKIKERNPDAWPHIARYWQHIGHEWLAIATVEGRAYHPELGNTIEAGWWKDSQNRQGYICKPKRGGPNNEIVYEKNKKMPNGKVIEKYSKYGYECEEKRNYWHWSGAFIEWCMQENAAFQPDRLPCRS